MQSVSHVNPLTGEVILIQPGSPVETVVLDTAVEGPVYTEREGDAEVVGGTITITVQSVRPNEAHQEYMAAARAELESPEGVAALQERVAELPEAEREAVLENVRREALAQASRDCPYPPASIVRQTMANIPKTTAAEIAEAIRGGGVKGRNKVADLLSASTPVPKGAW